MREETEEDRQRRLEETRRQIEQATAQALNEIRAEVGDPVAARRGEDHPQDADRRDDQRRLIDEALAEIDFSQLEASAS